MDKYEVLGFLGEGCFGRVYKAKQINNSAKVALKVISKRGRSLKEVKALRRECEIQRHLHHPNIIQMLDSFETDNEIVVITEFAHRELTAKLSKEVYLSEEKVQIIVWDLISALYYLHSHRVLHRDLKPQNILLDSKNNTKLCDFGFARNMSTGTHVLTSIKGTPLYMAPELIEEHPYDHTADLWSLGCIIYELLVGAPPFCTTSILQLIRKIRHEDIELPTFISSSCSSFLKGLLQKDPKKRLSWPEILKHPFVKDHILILEDIPTKPLTRPLSYDTLQAKEQQRKMCLTQKAGTKLPSESTELSENNSSRMEKFNSSKISKVCTISNSLWEGNSKKEFSVDEKQVEQKFGELSLECNDSVDPKSLCDFHKSDDDCKKETLGCKITPKIVANNAAGAMGMEDTLNLIEDSSPIENEEWLVFLRRNIEEVMTGEMTSLCQSSVANIAISPLRNCNTSSKVIDFVASLFSLPFVVPGTPDDVLKQIKTAYIDIKLIANLMYASKLLLKRPDYCAISIQSSSTQLPLKDESKEDYRSTLDLTEDDLHALERIYLLICHLVHLDMQFLVQFCDSLVILNTFNILQRLLLLSKQRLRIVADLIAILTHILRTFPENFELIDQVILSSSDENEIEEQQTLNFIYLLRHSNPLLRERSCHCLKFLAKSPSKYLENMWSDIMKNTLEALVYDSIENVRNAAESAVEELQKTQFYHNKIVNINDVCTNEIQE